MAGNRVASPPQRRLVGLLGPAFVAAVAYVDPGNVAANVTAGARYGYLLVWVLVVSNSMAVVIQYLSAKLGLITGKGLPALLGESLSRPARLLYWAQAEFITAATDLAEVIGGAIALNLLFDLPLWWGGLIVGAVSLFLLSIQSRSGQRPFEFVVLGLLLIITIGFVSGLFFSGVEWSEAAAGLIPRFEGTPTVLLAASMLGATVMPHVIYLHSTLVRDRHGRELDPTRLKRLISATRLDVWLSLVVAGSVNIAMVLLAASGLRGLDETNEIKGAHSAILHTLGPGIALAFAVGLLASSLASTSVGCYAGAVVMSGLIRRNIPLLIRRSVTLIPALAILVVGIDPTWALVLSQVFLGLGIPFALIPLVVFTSRRSLMGSHVNRLPLKVLAWAFAGVIIALNVALIALTPFGAH